MFNIVETYLQPFFFSFIYTAILRQKKEILQKVQQLKNY